MSLSGTKGLGGQRFGARQSHSWLPVSVTYCCKCGTCEEVTAWKLLCYCARHIRRSETEQGNACNTRHYTQNRNWMQKSSLTCLKTNRNKPDINNCCWTLKRGRRDPTFVLSIIAGGEGWCYHYNPQTKRQSAEWQGHGLPPSKKVKRQQSKTKTMLILFFLY